MKKTNFYIASLALVAGLGACNNTGSGTTGPGDTAVLRPGDSTITTTTTVTTTHHRYAGNFVPQPDIKYLDLRTRKQVTVHIDTVRGEVVNAETNEPLDLFVDPVKHDTIYGMTGSVVNNYIIKDESGAYRVDTVRINTVEVHTVTAEPEMQTTVNGKYKEKDNKTKLKTDDQKIKEKNGVIKVKDR